MDNIIEVSEIKNLSCFQKSNISPLEKDKSTLFFSTTSNHLSGKWLYFKTKLEMNSILIISEIFLGNQRFKIGSIQF